MINSEKLEILVKQIHEAYYGLYMENESSVLRLHDKMEELFNTFNITESLGDRSDKDKSDELFEKYNK